MAHDKLITVWRVVLLSAVAALAAILGRVILVSRDVHPQAVTLEIAAWEQEYSHPRNPVDANRSINMLEYIETYYPYERMGNYRRTHAVDALAAQRRRTMQAIAEGLREYSGEQYGPQPVEWRRWLESQKLPDANQPLR